MTNVENKIYLALKNSVQILIMFNSEPNFGMETQSGRGILTLNNFTQFSTGSFSQNY